MMTRPISASRRLTMPAASSKSRETGLEGADSVITSTYYPPDEVAGNGGHCSSSVERKDVTHFGTISNRDFAHMRRDGSNAILLAHVRRLADEPHHSPSCECDVDDMCTLLRPPDDYPTFPPVALGTRPPRRVRDALARAHGQSPGGDGRAARSHHDSFRAEGFARARDRRCR